MAGLNLNVGTSVLKRETRSIDQVEQHFLDRGWSRTGSALGGRVRYIENGSINLTLISGPLGTVVAPSGPVRGALFGDGAVSVGQNSAIGAGSSKDAASSSDNPRTTGKGGEMT